MIVPSNAAPHRSLFDPTRHEPLQRIAWDPARAWGAIDAILADTLSCYRPDRYWPTHPNDARPGEDPALIYTTLYFGAAGVLWALAYLRKRGLALPGGLPPFDAGELIGHNARWLSAEGFGEDRASYLMGETPIRLMAALQHGAAEQLDALGQLLAGNLGHASRELMWGAPGALLAALFLAETTGEARWADLFREGAARLWAQLEWSDTHGCAFWTQDLYGHRTTYLDAVHGFVATAVPLLRGAGLLEPGTRDAWRACLANTVQRSVTRHGGFANWRVFLDTPPGREPKYLMQFCHGAPGFVVCMAAHPDSALDELLLAAGETIWAAGPLSKGANLCHGTGGNGYALLKLYGRSGDPLWLARARAFAMHAIAQSDAEAARIGHRRHSLWTGDLGLAIFLVDCIRGEAMFPTLDVF